MVRRMNTLIRHPHPALSRQGRGGPSTGDEMKAKALGAIIGAAVLAVLAIGAVAAT